MSSKESELVNTLTELAKTYDYTNLRVMKDYYQTFQDVERKHESCYGLLASHKSSNLENLNYCMGCVANNALLLLEESYKKESLRGEEYEQTSKI